MRRGVLSTSYRRRLLDKDLSEACDSLQGLIVDLGGEWEHRRGAFRPPETVRASWICVNLEPDVAPDVVGDIARAPIVDSCADAVVCTEVLEHVPAPERVLAEAHRLLRPGGRSIVSVPFMSPIHADPDDYQRYTATKLAMLLTAAGFNGLHIRPQGLYFSVLSDMVRSALARVRPTLARWALALLAVPILDSLVQREARNAPSTFVASHVAGYFVTAHRGDDP